ncbi:MAG TPA: MFS transporter [Gammaproteobacteria bacterium]|nr:MFS transporter [Gammaproteobacteria bacterium]
MSNRNPFVRAATWLAPVEPRETRVVAAAFCLFFCVMAGYFAVRPLRETVGTVLGRDQVANLWVVNAFLSVLIIPAYGAVVARFRRSVFLPAAYACVAAVLAAIGFTMEGGQFPPFAAKVFYVFISLLNLFLISMFWSFLLEIFDKRQTKRLFSVIAAGGSAGALAGPAISDLTVASIGSSGLLYLGAGLFAAAIVCQRILLQLPREWNVEAASARDDRPIGGNVFAGATLILRSPYLIGIALFIVGVSTVSTFLYFEQLRLAQITYPDLTDRTRVFARLDWIVQALTFGSQILLTGRIAARFGLTTLLTMVPAAMVVGFLALAGNGTFLALAVVYVIRRWGEYAFLRPAREMLWSPLDKERKYKAKTTVDVPVYRGADAVIAKLNSALANAGLAASGVMLLGAAVAAAWGAVGWWLGRRFESGATVVPKAAPIASQSVVGGPGT